MSYPMNVKNISLLACCLNATINVQIFLASPTISSTNRMYVAVVATSTMGTPHARTKLCSESAALVV